MFGKVKSFLKRNVGRVTAGVTAATVIATNASAENAMTTAAMTQITELQADVVTLQGGMLLVVITMAIAAIIFAIVRKR